MKRRDFLIGSTSLAGLALPGAARAQGVPCPPPAFTVGGGTSVSTACAGASAESDWLARIGAAGVVWCHDFRHDDEVNNFRFVPNYGTDRSGTAGQQPAGSHARRITTDGITGGGCMEIVHPANATGNIAQWWRPMFPIAAGQNGRTSNDPAAGGSVPLVTYNPNDQGAYAIGNVGMYGHPDYRTAAFHGWDFYLQFRVKMPASRFVAGQPSGKLLYIDMRNGDNQELIIQSVQDRLYNMYTNFGGRWNAALEEPQGAHMTGEPRTNWQPGNEAYPGMPHDCAGCWCWPADEWVTVLVYMKPGRNTGGDNGPTESEFLNARSNPSLANTEIKVWVARAGQTQYTKIWDKTNYVWNYGATMPFAFNLIKASVFMNGVTGPQAFFHRYDQFILSKNFIACPQV